MWKRVLLFINVIIVCYCMLLLLCLLMSHTGYDAVDWMLETVGGLDRRQAVNLGVRMWASGFFKHVGSKRPFSDGPNHFYFAVDDKNRFPFPPPWPPSHGTHRQSLSFRLLCPLPPIRNRQKEAAVAEGQQGQQAPQEPPRIGGRPGHGRGEAHPGRPQAASTPSFSFRVRTLKYFLLTTHTHTHAHTPDTHVLLLLLSSLVSCRRGGWT